MAAASDSPVTSTEFDSFFWLSAAEKAAVRKRGQEAIEQAKKNGTMIGLMFAKPELGALFAMLNGGEPKFEWKKHVPSQRDEEFEDLESDEYNSYEDDYATEAPVGRGPPMHGRVELDAATRDVLEARIAAALAADGQHALEEEQPEAVEAGLTRAQWMAAMDVEAERVHALLRTAGEADPESLSLCMRAALGKGAFGFSFTGAAAELDDNTYAAECRECNAPMTATIREMLHQPDYGGNDYEDGGLDAVLCCTECESGGVYITRMCDGGDGTQDSGKFHNHCRSCPGLGVCIGDYRNSHCDRCGRHPFVGSMGNFKCSCHALHMAVKRARLGDRAALAAIFFHTIVFSGRGDGDEFDDEDADFDDEDEDGDV